MKTAKLLCAALAAFLPFAAAAQSVEEKVDALQKEVDRLKAEVARRDTPPAGEATSLFGYGEFNYNRYRDADRTSRADLRRFVLGVAHSFNERLSFLSEVELEHAVVSKDDEGEIEIEQAYLDYQASDAFNVKGGLFLIPLGILNETHEPPSYFGVERNEVETRIIPTTWRELGVGAHGQLRPGLRYDAGVTTGFNTGKLDDPGVGIRSAHQEGQLADARDLSLYGALNYRAPGWLVGGGMFTGNTGQNGQANALLKGVDARLTLWDVHARYAAGRWDLQALYAAGTLGDAERLTAALGLAAPKSLKGWYTQAAYHLYRRGDLDFAPFVRLERFEIRQQEDPANGLLQDPANLERVRTVGFNLYLHPQVVVKADVQRYSTDRTRDRLNVGLGYMF
jgi:opacity protein-like surface antigen